MFIGANVCGYHGTSLPLWDVSFKLLNLFGREFLLHLSDLLPSLKSGFNEAILVRESFLPDIFDIDEAPMKTGIILPELLVSALALGSDLFGERNPRFLWGCLSFFFCG